MSRARNYVHGTIVEAGYLNEDQEVDTGLAWGIRLAQGSASSVETGVVGDPYDSQGPMIIAGRRVWKNGASSPAVGAGSAGTREIFVSTTEAIAPNYTVEVLPTGSTPATAYYRRVGTADWNGTSVLDNIKLEHGVQAEANQFNQFTFKSISDAVGEVPVTVAGYQNQNSSAAHLLSIGSDDGSGYKERFSVRGDGRVALTPASETQTVLQAGGINDTLPRFAMTAEGIQSWGDGSLAHDTFVARTAAGTLKVHDGTLGGDGVIDLVFLQNTDTGGAGVNGAGMVNVLDDLNLSAGHVFRIDGEQFDSDMLADAADIAHLPRTETFTGLKTFSALTTFTGGQAITGVLGIDRQGAAASDPIVAGRVGTEANNRFSASVDGQLQWGAGGATAMDVSMARTAANIVSMGAGDRIEQAYNATVAEPTILVNRGTLDNTLNEETASKAFAYFVS